MTTAPAVDDPLFGDPEHWLDEYDYFDDGEARRLGLIPRPDALDLVLEAATLEATFASQRLMRVHAMRMEMLAEAVGRGDGARDIIERSIRLQLATALRITEYAAGRMITHAEALACRYPATLDSLSRGDITVKHVEILVDELDQLPPDLRSQVTARALELAEAESVGPFRRALVALIETVQAPTLEERYQSAVRRRRIGVERGEDGMGTLYAHAPLVALQAIFGRATQIAKTITADAGETRTLDQVRADVLCDLLIDGMTDSIPAEARGIRASVVVTVPALTLLGKNPAASAPGAPQPAAPGTPRVPGDSDRDAESTPTDAAVSGFAGSAIVEGVGPIPMSVARELCGGDSSWMRVLTHPETGMVLSVGRTQYRPPAALRKLVKWRADRCMAPGCGVPASRCEVDHQLAWEHGGETSLQNSAPLCKGHHIVKHHGGWTVTQHPDACGALEWLSPTGRRYTVQPERRIPVFVPAPVNGSDASGDAAPF